MGAGVLELRVGFKQRASGAPLTTHHGCSSGTTGGPQVPPVVICQEHSLKAQEAWAGCGDTASALPGSATPGFTAGWY